MLFTHSSWSTRPAFLSRHLHVQQIFSWGHDSSTQIHRARFSDIRWLTFAECVIVIVIVNAADNVKQWKNSKQNTPNETTTMTPHTTRFPRSGEMQRRTRQHWRESNHLLSVCYNICVGVKKDGWRHRWLHAGTIRGDLLRDEEHVGPSWMEK